MEGGGWRVEGWRGGEGESDETSLTSHTRARAHTHTHISHLTFLLPVPNQNSYPNQNSHPNQIEYVGDTLVGYNAYADDAKDEEGAGAGAAAEGIASGHGGDESPRLRASSSGSAQAAMLADENGEVLDSWEDF